MRDLIIIFDSVGYEVLRDAEAPNLKSLGFHPKLLEVPLIISDL